MKKDFYFMELVMTDGTIERYNITIDKFKPKLHEGQKIRKISDGTTKFVHIVREHTPNSVKALQLERNLVSIPTNLISFKGNDTYELSKQIRVNMLNDKLTPNENIEYYQVIIDSDTVLQQVSDCNNSVILNTLHKLRLSDNGIYDIISINHPDYKKIKFGKCDHLMNRDEDIRKMRNTNTFVKGVMNNLFKKTGDTISRRSFELSNIESQENSLMNSEDIKDFYNYEKNSLINTNPYSDMDELENYYELNHVKDLMIQL